MYRYVPSLHSNEDSTLACEWTKNCRNGLLTRIRRYSTIPTAGILYFDVNLCPQKEIISIVESLFATI